MHLILIRIKFGRPARPHGRDFSPLLRGETVEKRQAVFGQYDLHNHGLAYMRMIRTERYKLVRHSRAHFMDELYDLDEDPDEKRNLLRKKGDPPEAHDQLKKMLRSWMESIDDPLLEDW